MDILVLDVKLHDNKIKKKATKAMSSLSGVESVTVDPKGEKMTLIGNMDAVLVVEMMRKLCPTEIHTLHFFGPASEESKKNEKKKAKNKKIIQNDDDEYTEGCRSCEYQKRHAHDDSSSDEDIPSCKPKKDMKKSKNNPNACVIC